MILICFLGEKDRMKNKSNYIHFRLEYDEKNVSYFLFLPRPFFFSESFTVLGGLFVMHFGAISEKTSYFITAVSHISEVTKGFAEAKGCWSKVGCPSCHPGWMFLSVFIFIAEEKNVIGTAWAWISGNLRSYMKLHMNFFKNYF